MQDNAGMCHQVATLRRGVDRILAHQEAAAREKVRERFDLGYAAERRALPTQALASDDVDVFEEMVQGRDPPEEVNGMGIFERYGEPRQLAVLPQDRQIDCAVKVHSSPASVVWS
jgi:hypothetical protein